MKQRTTYHQTCSGRELYRVVSWKLSPKGHLIFLPTCYVKDSFFSPIFSLVLTIPCVPPTS